MSAYRRKAEDIVRQFSNRFSDEDLIELFDAVLGALTEMHHERRIRQKEQIAHLTYQLDQLYARRREIETLLSRGAAAALPDVDYRTCRAGIVGNLRDVEKRYREARRLRKSILRGNHVSVE